MGVLHETADAVSAHLRLALIGLKEPHPDVGGVRCLEEEDAVSADAEPAVTEERCKPSFHIFGDGFAVVLVDQDEVVAVSVQFGERNIHGLASPLSMGAAGDKPWWFGRWVRVGTTRKRG